MPNPTIDRRCHWLRRNDQEKRPEILVFVDVESYLDPINEHADQHSFRLGWACLCRYTPAKGLYVIGWHKITDPIAFWNTIGSVAVNYKETYVISHNIDYDARILRAFSILPRIGWNPDYLILADSCHFFTFAAEQNRISLLDNLNYWSLPLDDLGIEFGIEKLSIDFATCTDQELSIYCRRDVEILVKAWQYWLSFLDEHHLGNWSITVSGQSWNAYRHRFMPCSIGIHNRADVLELERDAYKGGRCETLKIGRFNGQRFYKLDVNGLYAYCMQACLYPQKLVKTLVDVDPQYLKTLLERYHIIAQVILDTDQPVYAIQKQGYNVFPIGSFQTTLTTHELEYALDHNHIVGIGNVALYEKADLFSRFIDYFTPLRQQYKSDGDTGRSLLCKMIRNALYGKFGQRGYKQEIIADAPIDVVKVTRWVDAETGKKCVDWTFGGKVIRQVYEGEGKDSFPAIAAHVAANGRLLLWDYAQKAGLENIWYMDTDSLIVNRLGYDNLKPWIDPLDLGYLKVEYTAVELQITARKSYQLGEKATHKGIKKNAQQTDNGTWKQTQFTSLKWAFAHGNLDDVLTYEIEKAEHATLFHGTVDKLGNVHPPLLACDPASISSQIVPTSFYQWVWWIDPYWFGSLEPADHRIDLPDWYLNALRQPEADAPD